MSTTRECRPASVPEKAKQAGDIYERWRWVEPSVWTERMLTALENGVKGGRWFSLIDKVYSEGNLRAAFKKVKQNRGAAGVDRQTSARFELRLEENLQRLADQLSQGTYQPQPIRRVWIPKPGKKERRPLGIPTVRDRIVQSALRSVIEPIFERDFAQHSYGFRPGRGCKDALRRVDSLLNQGYTYVVDADICKYFDTIPHQGLLAQVAEKISDSRVLELIESYLSQRVMDTAKEWEPEGEGTPQGAVISPLLSNIYLSPLDHRMTSQGYEMVRYADDLVILCRSRSEAEAALKNLEEWTAAAGLTLHPEKTRLVNAEEPGGFDFLGYHFERGKKWPSKKNIKKFREVLRPKTRRANGQSLTAIIADVNRTTRGWFEYFKHSQKTTFPRLDQWIRMRLRSILRKRRGGKGRGRGEDHQRWPNAFFDEQGLFSLVAARASLGQSRQR